MLSCLSPFVYLLSKTFILFGFPILSLLAYLMKVVQETRRAH